MSDLESLLIRWDAGACSPEELADLKRQLADSANRARMVEHLRLTISITEVLRVRRVEKLQKIGPATKRMRQVAARLQRRTWLPRWFLWPIAATLALALGGWWWLVANPDVADCAIVAGSAQLLRDERRMSITGPTSLQSGDVLTAEDGALVRYRDGTSLSSAGGMSIQLLSPGPGRRLHLALGALDAEVRQQQPEAPFEISTPQALVRIVGTRFHLSVGSEGTRLRVSEGLVRLATPHDVVMVAAGREFLVGQDSSMRAVANPLAPQVEMIFHGQQVRSDHVGRAAAAKAGLEGFDPVLDTVTGDQRFSSDQIVRNKRFTGRVEVVGGKITFEFCSFEWAPSAGGSQLRQYDEGQEAGQVVCNWCDFDPGLRGGQGADRTSNVRFGERGTENPGTVGSAFVLYRCRLNGCGSGVSVNRYRSSGSQISECLISELTTGGGNNPYGMQMLSADNIEVRRSRIELGRSAYSAIAIMPDFGEIPEAKPLLVQDCYISGGAIPILVTRYDDADGKLKGGRFIENVSFIGNHFGDASHWGRLCNFHHLDVTFDPEYARNHPRTLYWARSNAWAPDGEDVAGPERAPSGDVPAGLPHVPGAFVDERNFFGGQHWLWNGKVLP